MKHLVVLLIARLTRAQRRALGIMALLPLTLGRPLWSQSNATAPAPMPAPNTVRAALAHVTAPACGTRCSELGAPLDPPSLTPEMNTPISRSPVPGASDLKPSREHRAANIERHGQHWLEGLQLLGQKTLPFRWVSVSGSPNARRAFESSAVQFGATSEVTLMGRLLDLLDVNVTLSDNPYGIDSRRMAARFQQGDTRVSVGDVTASLAGNGLVPFQRSVRGLVVEQELGPQTHLVGLFSANKAPVRHLTISGNNTVGPYYLNAFPIEIDSVRVRINETDVPRDAYTIDPYAGTITFKSGQIVPQTSVLRISFSTRATGDAAGNVYGGRLTHALAGGHTIGLTVMGQATPSRSSTGSVEGRERADDWAEGHADSVGPFQLRFGPVVRGSEQVFVGGVLQRAGVDYVIDADRGFVQFTRLILSSEPIRILYRQVREGQLQERIAGQDSPGPYHLSAAPVLLGSESVTVTDGGPVSIPLVRDRDYRLDAVTGSLTFLDRSLARGTTAVVLYRPRRALAVEPAAGIVGIDGTLRLGKSAQVAAQIARSGGGEGASGTAMTLEGKVGLLPGKNRAPRLRLGAALKSIDPAFAPVDTGSFLRNEKGLALDGDFTLNPYVRLYSRWQQVRRPLDMGAVVPGGTLVDARESASGVTVQYPGWPSLTIQSTRLDQDGPTGDSRQATDSVRLQYDRGRVRVASEWALGESAGQTFASVGATTTAPARTNTGKLSVGYSPSERLSLSVNGVTSQIRTEVEGSDRDTTARSVDLNATYRPTRAVQLSADYVVSNSGRLTSTVASAGTIPPSVRGALIPGEPPQPPNNGGSPADPVPDSPHYWGAGGAGSQSVSEAERGSGSLSGPSSGPATRALPGLVGVGIPGSVAYGGNQRTGRLGVTYAPGGSVSLNANFDVSDTELYGKTVGHGIGFSFLPAKALALTGTVSRQAARFGDGLSLTGSGLQSDLTYLSLRAGPFGKLSMNLDYQGLHSRGLVGATGVGGGSGANDVRTWTGRLSHPVGGHVAFLQYQDVGYGGGARAHKGSAVAGIELRLGRVLGLTLDVELHRYRDERRPADSYRARIVSGHLSARF